MCKIAGTNENSFKEITEIMKCHCTVPKNTVLFCVSLKLHYRGKCGIVKTVSRSECLIMNTKSTCIASLPVLGDALMVL